MTTLTALEAAAIAGTVIVTLILGCMWVLGIGRVREVMRS